MGDVFDRLAARAAGNAPALAVRRASRFEPVRDRQAAAGFAGVVPLEVERVDDAPPDHRAPAARRSDPPEPPVPAAPSPAREAAPTVGRRAPTRTTRPLPEPPVTDDPLGAMPPAARTHALPAARTPAPEPVVERAPTTPFTTGPEQPRTETVPAPERAVAPPVRPAAAATEPRPVPAEPDDDPGETSATTPRGPAGARDQTVEIPPRPGSRTVPAALLLERLAPALLDARALTRRETERLVVVPTTTPRRARPDGRGQVRLDDVRVGAGEVHVHVDRIEVSREPAPVPAPPRPAAPSPAIDHAAYLAREDRRWAR
ncbi:hypothetical protein [Cellulomonas terrae]|uniref:Uncharacterized protein n=1 Tax=Cellulomonas terrae TaxID=311234 RepID=A0A511JHF9_9CELL|nr:hypothetical protein [Cellulomonas terrae]GEL97437.1 hypothetical protein CTE05_09840 [Cellulomonas terrae]